MRDDSTTRETSGNICPLCGTENAHSFDLSKADIISLNLNRVMGWRRLGDQDVADGTGLTAHAIGNIRRNIGKNSPRASTLQKLDLFFGLNISDRILEENEIGSKYGFSSEKYGAYEIGRYRFLESDYIFVRKSFDYDDGLVCSHLKISYSNGDDCLRFFEYQRNISREGTEHSFDFSGTVSIPSDTGILQFVSGDTAIKRIHNLKINQTSTGVAFLGVLQTLNKDAFKGFYPAVTPVFGRSAENSEMKSIKSIIGSIKNSEVWDASIPGILEKIKSEYIS